MIAALLLVPLILAATVSADSTQYGSNSLHELFIMEGAGDISTEDLITELLRRKANRVGTGGSGSEGAHLIDGSEMTLYLYTRDERNVSNCSGGCATAWPPLTLDGDAVAVDGVNSGRLATIERDDGSIQVTYNGKPLYYYVNDEKPGDALGQDRGDVWFKVSPDGGPIRTTASVIAAQSEALGTILTDASGNSLYLYTRDERNLSNCYGRCALAWPPLRVKRLPELWCFAKRWKPRCSGLF